MNDIIAPNAPAGTNSPKDLISYFGEGTTKVTVPEFSAFWKSCTNADKAYLRTVDLKTGLVAK